jgi:hypothetical protein
VQKVSDSTQHSPIRFNCCTWSTHSLSHVVHCQNTELMAVLEFGLANHSSRIGGDEDGVDLVLLVHLWL